MSEGDEELAKDLGLVSVLTIGIGTMIGAGIFVLPGQAAAAAGPAVALSFVVGGTISIFTALSASELGTAMPKAGGSYYFVNHALGPLFGSIAGWGNWMGLAFASAFYMLGFGEYLATFVPIPALHLGLFSLSSFQLGALLAGLAFIGVNYVGAKETGGVQIAIVTVLVAILTLFSVLGAFQVDLATLRPIFPSDAGGPMAILPATGLVFVSFIGFAQITTVAEELKNPGRNLPIALVGSVVIVTAMYGVIMVVLMGMINWRQLTPDVTTTPLLDAAAVAFGTIGVSGVGIALLTFAGLLATASSANASILASSRINFAMGRDKLITPKLNAIHPTFATPYRSIGVTGALILVFIVLGDVETLAKVGSLLHLLVYGLLNVGLIVMREADTPEFEPSFRVPFYPAVPIIGAITSFGLIAFMNPIEIGLSGAFVVGSVIWYFVYARGETENQGILSEFVLDRQQRMPDAVVSAATSIQPDGGTDRVMVGLSNPATETDLLSLASALARQRDGEVHAVHVVTVPDQTSLEYASEHPEQFAEDYHAVLDQAKRDAETVGVTVETHTIFSHHAYEELFEAADSLDADLAVIGRSPHAAPGRAETALEELTMDVPCDFLVLDGGFDPTHLLVPTAGGPDSELSADVTRDIRAEFDAEVTLLHVTDDEAAGRTFLESWAADHRLEDAAIRVEPGDPATVISAAADDATLVVMGATERGLLSRWLRGTPVVDAAEIGDTSVLLAERPHDRGLLAKLLGE